MKSTCIAILNYNGVHHLEHLLPTALAAAARHERPCPVIVLDNRSTRGDAEWVRAQFPAVTVIVAPENDFLFSYNWLLKQLDEEIVVLLNNDLRVAPDFIAPLLRHFESDDVFAVCATSRDWDDTAFTCGPAHLHAHHGIYYWPYETALQQPAHTLFASAGFMAVDRAKFLELGGFNPLFRPAYSEDLDLGFRAWRRGWRSVFEPASRVWHRENGTWQTGRVARLCLRGQLLFQWASLPPSGGRVERLAMHLVTVARRAIQGDIAWPVMLLRTWQEWRRVRGQFAWMKTPRAELDGILQKIHEPLPRMDSIAEHQTAGNARN